MNGLAEAIRTERLRRNVLAARATLDDDLVDVETIDPADVEAFRHAVTTGDWPRAAALLAPDIVTADPAAAHLEVYQWAAGIEAGQRARPVVLCLARGAAKSSTLRLAVALTACAGTRSFPLWVHARADKATEAVSAVADLLSRPLVRAAFPEAATPYQTRRGRNRDDRLSRYRTASGFAIEATGLDVAARGSLVDDIGRPDLIVLDDIESEHDSPLIRSRKLTAVSRRFLPMLAPHGTVAFAQNRISKHSIMSAVLDGTAEILSGARIIGPVPQVDGLEYEARTDDELDALEAAGQAPLRWRITAGTPTWEGQDLAVSELELNDLGPSAFLAEKQHAVDSPQGGLFDPGTWVYVAGAEVALGKWAVRAWDLALTEEGESLDPDWTVGALVTLDNRRRPIVVDVVRGRWGPDGVERSIVDTWNRDRAQWGRKVTAVLEEQPAATNKLWRPRWDRALAGISWEPIGTGGRNKAERAAELISTQRRGDLTVAEDHWTAAFIEECESFGHPGAAHDDQVDAVVHAFRWLLARSKVGDVRIAASPKVVTRNSRRPGPRRR